MDIVVKGRRATVTDRFRHHVETKLAKLERFDHKAYRVDVELSRERNPRLSGVRERVELTVFSRGPVIRAEAAATDAYAALDVATAKLTERMRRAADRRLRKHAQAPAPEVLFPESLPGPAPALAGPAVSANGSSAPAPPASGIPAAEAAATGAAAMEAPGTETPAAAGGAEGTGEASPMVVREKIHHAPAMTLDDALSNMELVGHDFYLFHDSSTDMPSVVYRRRGYDYGVLRLRTVEMSELPDTPDARADDRGAPLTR